MEEYRELTDPPVIGHLTEFREYCSHYYNGCREERPNYLDQALDEAIVAVRHAGALRSVLAEFVGDVRAAHGKNPVPALGKDWPDLAITYNKAAALLNRLSS
jgi:hypothetical protein